MLAVSSLATYGILLAGWSANSKYAFLGSLRSTAQLISYELILSSAILLVVLLSGSFNLTVIIESQKSVWFLIPLLPVFIIFFIASVAETNRAPFDLAEAESELVSGFMTEHAAVIFVFFFLAEYASIILICILISVLFLGGYEVFNIYNISNFNFFSPEYTISNNISDLLFSRSNGNDYMIKELLYGLSLSIKSCLLIFAFIWVRASYPRIRFDRLMTYCWTILLPLVIGLIILIPCILYSFDILPSNVLLL
jgi:NADH-ubiquinone oxidoreductase chain 1